MEIGTISTVNEVDSCRRIAGSAVDCIAKARVDRCRRIEEGTFDAVADEYLNRSRIMVHEDFVVDMSVEEMAKWLLFHWTSQLAPEDEGEPLVAELVLCRMRYFRRRSRMKRRLIRHRSIYLEKLQVELSIVV